MKTPINSEELKLKLEQKIQYFALIRNKQTIDDNKSYYDGIIRGLEEAIYMLVGNEKQNS